MDGNELPTDKPNRQRDFWFIREEHTVFTFESVICKPVAVRDSAGLG